MRSSGEAFEKLGQIVDTVGHVGLRRAIDEANQAVATGGIGVVLRAPDDAPPPRYAISIRREEVLFVHGTCTGSVPRTALDGLVRAAEANAAAAGMQM